MWTPTVSSDELYHFGTKGMHWGIRRYQNPDGTLTEAGKRRYSKGEKKAARKKELKKNVKDYSEKFNAWNDAQDKNDEAWRDVQEKRKAIGKTPITRTINATFKTNDPKVKEYAKAFYEWSDKQDILDQSWREVAEAYSKTGKTHVTRILNNIKYDPNRKQKNS